MNRKNTIIIGHKNPDTDSIAAAITLSYLKKAQGHKHISAASAGKAPARTAFIFKKFGVELPPILQDIAPTIDDIMNQTPATINQNATLLHGAQLMQENYSDRLPVVDDNNKYLGMISLFDLTKRFFQKSSNFNLDGNNSGLFGRSVTSSINLAATALHAKVCNQPTNPDKLRKLNVFVGAMDRKNAKAHFNAADTKTIALVIGNREALQALAIECGIAMLIITGKKTVSSYILNMANKYNVAILQTAFDSATAVRRLKFSSPVKLLLQENVTTFYSSDHLHDIKHILRKSSDDLFTVVDENNFVTGTFSKLQIEDEPPTNLILVDHNELNQAVHGADELPIIEIVDHHRISIGPTERPIKITCDIVGATCTLIYEMFKESNIIPPKDIAGILLGGIVTDTLFLRSPTSTFRDKNAIKELEHLCEYSGAKLLEETLDVGSVIASFTAPKVIKSDYKTYNTNKYTFAVSQIEENGFHNFNTTKDVLLQELENVLISENLDVACLLVTDVIAENSVLLVCGKRYLINNIPYHKIDTNLYDLPRILSRKKQLLPELLKAFE